MPIGCAESFRHTPKGRRAVRGFLSGSGPRGRRRIFLMAVAVAMARRMRIGRRVPPAAAPLCWKDLWHGVSGIFSPERSLRALEAEIRRHFAVSHVFLVSSGTAALTLTLMALKSLSPKTEVVMPAYTCFSVPTAILKSQLRPSLFHISPDIIDLVSRSLQ